MKMESTSIKRYLENDTVIEFTDPIFTGENVEVSINHNPSHKMWLSQFKGFYADIIEENPLYSSITLKKEGKLNFYNMDGHTFWNLVEKKQFKVSVEFYYKICWKEKRNLTLEFYDRLCRKLRIYLLRKDTKAIDCIASKNSPKYDLIEI